MRKFRFILAGASLLTLAACGGGDGNEIVVQKPQPGTGFFAAFSPATGVVPFPIDILFSGSTDGTLNIPVTDPTDFGDPTVAINALDGFSTVAPITTTFSTAIDVTSLSTPGAVRVFEATGSASGVTGIARELAAGSEYVATVSPADVAQTTLVIVPLQPLAAKTTYVIALSDSIKGTDGSASVPDTTYVLTQISDPIVNSSGGSLVAAITDAQAQALEPLRQLVNAQEAALAGAGVDTESLILSWSVSTQSIDDVLQAVKSTVVPQASKIAATNLTTANIDFSSQGIENLSFAGTADIYAGSLTISYYLEPTAPYSGFWKGFGGSNLTRFNPMPVANLSLPIPLLITVPNIASGHTKPAEGWPVAIFQHGINHDRTEIFLVAEALAAAGYAAVSIDFPYHGITDTSSVFYTPFERTFDLDVVNNATGAPGADTIIDATGTAFLNLRSLLTLRDNGRQGAADMMQLDASLATMDIDGDAIPDFNVSRRGYVLHSLGGIINTSFLALSDDSAPASLGMVGGGLANLFAGSPSFGPVLEAGLGSVGILPGTTDFQRFLVAFQTVADSADPVNYAAAAAAKHPIHFIEAVGGAGVLSDQTVPNTVTGAPLSGSEPMIALMGLPPVSSTASGSGAVRFAVGNHRSYIDPTNSPSVTAEMQSQFVNFISSNGDEIVIGDPSMVR